MMQNKLFFIYQKSSHTHILKSVEKFSAISHILNNTNYVHTRTLACGMIILPPTPSFTYTKTNATILYRYLHSTPLLKIPANEPSKIEETVKVIREETEKSKKEETAVGVVPQKRSLGKKIWDEIVHYYHGFRLLFIDLKVSTRLAWALLQGKDLTRREHKLLVRTVSDLFRLVPFTVVVLVPFLELALPILLRFFPGMLPSQFTKASDREAKFKKQLRLKIEMAKFLHETLDEMAVKSKGESHSQTAKEFAQFFEKIRSTGEEASNQDILKFSKLFEDEITLDSLSRPQLIALCRLLELQPLGTNNFLRFQLRNRIRSLRADDKMIMNEGIDAMSIQEIQAACRARGMRALGLPVERLKSQLNKWLDLSLRENIPPSLLLLSRALYLPEHLQPSDQLKVTLSSLSDTAATETKYKIGEMEGKVDNKTKLELIKKEEEEIKREAEELKLVEQLKDELINKKITIDVTTEPDMIDKAPPIKDHAEKIITEKRAIDEVESQVSKEDLDEIETAIENIASEKKKLLLEKEEIEDLKEEMAEYNQDIKELKVAILETGHKEINESKAAARLSNKVNKMISKMDTLVTKLDIDREQLQEQIDDNVKEGISSGKERDDIVTINEMVLAIRRIQKVSDDTRLQRIVDVLEKMDIDHDGAVEIDHVLKVIELLGKDNVKVSSKQMDDIMKLLTSEEILELEDKMKQKSAEESGVEQKNNEKPHP